MKGFYLRLFKEEAFLCLLLIQIIIFIILFFILNISVIFRIILFIISIFIGTPIILDLIDYLLPSEVHANGVTRSMCAAYKNIKSVNPDVDEYEILKMTLLTRPSGNQIFTRDGDGSTFSPIPLEYNIIDLTKSVFEYEYTNYIKKIPSKRMEKVFLHIEKKCKKILLL